MYPFHESGYSRDIASLAVPHDDLDAISEDRQQEEGSLTTALAFCTRLALTGSEGILHILHLDLSVARYLDGAIHMLVRCSSSIASSLRASL